jgi:single-strand DNA-binding protein
MAGTRRTASTTSGEPDEANPTKECNEVHLQGRVAAVAEERELPSGDHLVSLRVIVPRDPGTRRPKGRGESVTKGRAQTVDTIDLVCWTAQTRRAATRLGAGDLVEVRGALRRRFFGGAGGRQSRYEVEVALLRRVSGRPATDT